MSFGPRLNQIFDDRRVKLAAYAESTAAEALKDMQEYQKQEKKEPGKGWNNETYQALLGLISGPINEDDAIGFFVAHTIEYGVFLELANDRQNEILRPTAEKWALGLRLYAQELYGVSA
jgi:hypothetical protein